MSFPFLLEMYDDYVNDRLSSEDFLGILRLIESYVFRRAICSIPTNSLNKTFTNLGRSVDKNRYFDSFVNSSWLCLLIGDSLEMMSSAGNSYPRFVQLPEASLLVAAFRESRP